MSSLGLHVMCYSTYTCTLVSVLNLCVRVSVRNQLWWAHVLSGVRLLANKYCTGAAEPAGRAVFRNHDVSPTNGSSMQFRRLYLLLLHFTRHTADMQEASTHAVPSYDLSNSTPHRRVSFLIISSLLALIFVLISISFRILHHLSKALELRIHQ